MSRSRLPATRRTPKPATVSRAGTDRVCTAALVASTTAMDLDRIRNFSHHRPHRPRQVHARRPHPRADRRGRCPRTCARSTSTRWTSSASGASRSRPRTSGSSGTTTSSTSSTRPATSTSATRCRAPSPRARASSCSSTRRRASRRRRSRTATWPSRTTSRSWPRSTRSICPAAEPDRYADEIERVLGIPADEILRLSAKTGEGVAELLDAVVDRIPAPKGDRRRPAAGPHLRFVLRPVPRGHQLGAGHERQADDRCPPAVPADERGARSRRDRRTALRCPRPCRCSNPARSDI